MVRLTGRELSLTKNVDLKGCYHKMCDGDCSNCEVIEEALQKLKCYEDIQEEAEAKLQELQNGVTQSNDGVKEGK